VTAAAWRLTLASAALMALVAGGRAVFGLFVSPLNTASGMGLAMLSLALACGQLGVGFAQPLVGGLADRFGARRVIVCGTVLLAVTTALPVIYPLPLAIFVALTVSALVGSAVASNALLVGEVSRGVPAMHAGLAVGIVGAGASVGQLLLGPATQRAIDEMGWSGALLATSGLCLVALPLALAFTRAKTERPAAATARPASSAAEALRQRYFWRLAGSFGVCGFHVAFLNVHMPGVIERCGLPASLAGTWLAIAGASNIVGSIATGLALKRWAAGWMLVALYGMRAVGIAVLLALPVSPLAMLGFAVVMGATYMAILPPTAQLVSQRYGVQRLGMLFGVVMLVHQAGSFLGIWLGGWAVQATGSDTLLWLVDAGLAIAAAAMVWPARGRRAANAAPLHRTAFGSGLAPRSGRVRPA
jgi:predicted MFS family arabinose efflux permease